MASSEQNQKLAAGWRPAIAQRTPSAGYDHGQGPGFLGVNKRPMAAPWRVVWGPSDATIGEQRDGLWCVAPEESEERERTAGTPAVSRAGSNGMA
jgi:hypothetical protein